MTVEYASVKKIPHPATWAVVYKSSTSFWEGIKEKQLLLQRCKQCSKWLHPPRPVCPKCRSRDHEWVPLTGKGSIYSWATIHESPHPAFKSPYTVVLVEMDEGPRLVSNMIDVTPEELQIGMSVEAVFDDVAEDLTLPKFRRVTSADKET